MKNTKIKAEPSGVPFPQADKFERIINLCELLNSGDYDRNQVTQNYDFDGRQTKIMTVIKLHKITILMAGKQIITFLLAYISV